MIAFFGEETPCNLEGKFERFERTRCFNLLVLSYPANGSIRFIRNRGTKILNYTVSHPTR